VTTARFLLFLKSCTKWSLQAFKVAVFESAVAFFLFMTFCTLVPLVAVFVLENSKYLLSQSGEKGSHLAAMCQEVLHCLGGMSMNTVMQSNQLPFSLNCGLAFIIHFDNVSNTRA
jgi:hypothetical protein